MTTTFKPILLLYLSTTTVFLNWSSLNLKTEITILAKTDQISFVLWTTTKIGPRFSFNFTSNKKKIQTHLPLDIFQLSACQKLVRCSSKSLQNCLACRVYANKTKQLDGQMTLKNKVGNCNNTVEHKET